jgi:hypothetical protein
MRVPFAILLGVVAAGASVWGSQIGYLWSFDELRAKSDVVVIAEHTKTADTTRRVDHPELKPSLPVIELESEFNVLAVLSVNARDGAEMRQLRLKHYRIDRDEWRRRNPPQPGLPPVGLVNAGSVLDFTDGAGPYLLFLKRAEGGAYEPLSGQTFPTESVFLLRKQGGR